MSVVVVTGGGNGIGAAVAEELGRAGHYVVTMDPLVTLDGSSQQAPAEEATTAQRILASGGQARASAVSVTDAEGVRALFNELAGEFGRLDAVVNVAGISRPTNFASGSEEDWRAVLEVHVDGYRNVLEAALPLMAAAGYGRILGVTSGSGWRAVGDAGAYGDAKRTVASLTWQLGRQAPPGVSINAMSPIAVTRMVTAALARAGAVKPGAAAAGPLFGSMPEPEEIGPIGAYLASEDFAWCSGEVIFAGGAEAAVVERPRLLEVVRTDNVASLPHALDAVVAKAWVPAERNQLSGGGSNPRFASIFDASIFDVASHDIAPSVAIACAIVTDRPHVGDAVCAALKARGVATHIIDASDVAFGFAAASDALAAAGQVDGVVVALAGGAAGPDSWEGTLAEHADIVDRLHADASWARAAADHATRIERPIRLITLTDAVTAAGRSRAQAVAQHSRTARKTTKESVLHVAVSVESDAPHDLASTGVLAAHLVCAPDVADLSGAELVAGAGWLGLRSHPRPAGSITFGGPALPSWFDATLREIVGQ